MLHAVHNLFSKMWFFRCICASDTHVRLYFCNDGCCCSLLHFAVAGSYLDYKHQILNQLQLLTGRYNRLTTSSISAWLYRW